MALKLYDWMGRTWQFEEGEQPKGAVPASEPAAKKAPAKPANKARTARDKKA